MKKIEEHIVSFVSLVSGILTFLTFFSSYNQPHKEVSEWEALDWIFKVLLILSSSVLLVISIILSVRLNNREKKIQALYILSNEKRIHTLNFLLYLESLIKSNPEEYGKKSKPYIGDSSFSFTVHNKNLSKEKMADVQYSHTFDIGSNIKFFNVLILFSAGVLVDDDVSCEYNNNKIKTNINGQPSEVQNTQNSRIVCCSFGLNNNEKNISKKRFILLYWLKKLYKNKINIRACSH